jgi:hypothetical protein
MTPDNIKVFEPWRVANCVFVSGFAPKSKPRLAPIHHLYPASHTSIIADTVKRIADTPQ